MNVFGALFVLALIAGVLGLAGVVAIVFGIIYAARRGVYALKGEPYRPLLGSGKKTAYEHQDVDAGSNAESMKAIFRRYMQTDGVGPYARSALSAIEGVDRKVASFHAVLDTKFQPGSMSWDKFSVAATTSTEAVLRNCATLANEIQVFDHADYRRLEQIIRRSRFRSDVQLDPTQQEKHQFLKGKLSEMAALCERNEKILLELDKLITELNKLDSSTAASESERLVAEVRQLTEETKYYKQKLDEM